MKKTKRIVLTAAVACSLCALTACANRTDNGVNGTNPATTNAGTGRVTNGNNGVAGDLATDLGNGVENLATDLGITGTDNNAGTERTTDNATQRTTQPTTTTGR